MRKRYTKISNSKILNNKTENPATTLFRQFSVYIRKHVYIPVSVYIRKPLYKKNLQLKKKSARNVQVIPVLLARGSAPLTPRHSRK